MQWNNVGPIEARIVPAPARRLSPAESVSLFLYCDYDVACFHRGDVRALVLPGRERERRAASIHFFFAVVTIGRILPADFVFIASTRTRDRRWRANRDIDAETANQPGDASRRANLKRESPLSSPSPQQFARLLISVIYGQPPGELTRACDSSWFIHERVTSAAVAAASEGGLTRRGSMENQRWGRLWSPRKRETMMILREPSAGLHRVTAMQSRVCIRVFYLPRVIPRQHRARVHARSFKSVWKTSFFYLFGNWGVWYESNRLQRWYCNYSSFLVPKSIFKIENI